MATGKIELSISPDDQDVAYLSLPDHPGSEDGEIVQRQVRLQDLISGYEGADIYLDFDDQGRLIGLEILV